MMKCNICYSQSKSIFRAKVLNRHDVEYFYCPECGFIQTEIPYWLKEAYTRQINLVDTGIL